MKNDLYLWLRIHWKSWEMDDEKSFINMIGIWKWLMKISENGKPIINTSEIIFWIMIWKIMISMRIKMFALNSMEKKCMNTQAYSHSISYDCPTGKLGVMRCFASLWLPDGKLKFKGMLIWFIKKSYWQTLSLENHQKEADNSYAVKVVPSISPKISKNWGNNAKNNFLAKFLGKPGGRKWDQRISRAASA